MGRISGNSSYMICQTINSLKLSQTVLTEMAYHTYKWCIVSYIVRICLKFIFSVMILMKIICKIATCWLIDEIQLFLRVGGVRFVIDVVVFTT